MANFEEKVYISEFNIQQNGSINVRKTTEVLKDGVSISKTYWRCVLAPSETIDTEVLNEPYYANLAQAAWTPEVIAAYQQAQQEALMSRP
jgi:hypothetical protein